MQDKKTELIEQELSDSIDYETFIDENSEIMEGIHPGLYLSSLIEKSGIKKYQVVSQLNMNTGYAYEILRLEKVPDRDKMLQFALALGLNISETKEMLKKCRYAMLYVKNPRDAIIYFCISRRQNLIDTNIMLSEKGYDIL